MSKISYVSKTAIKAALFVLLSSMALPAEEDSDSLIPSESILLSPASGPGLPVGVLSAVVAGDVTKPGVYVLRNKFPPNAVLAPHTHGNKWRIYTILEGEVRFGFGTLIDELSMTTLGPGSVVTTFDQPHYFRTGSEGATLNVVAEGPFITNFVNP